jgi:hypothetical protein
MSSVKCELHFPDQKYRVFILQSILSAGTGISQKTEGHSFGDHLIRRLVSVTQSSVIEASIVLCSLSMTRVNQCPISLRADHPIENHKERNSRLKYPLQ